MSIDTIEEALERIETEQHSLRSEKRALLMFSDEVKNLPITPPAPRREERSGAGLEDVLELYRNALVSEDRLSADELEASFRHEFTGEQLSQLQREALTSQSKRGLLESIERSRYSRTKRLAVLEGEEKSLKNVRSELTAIDRRLEQTPTCSATKCSLENIVDTWEILDRLEHRCDEVLASRQSYLNGIRESGIGMDPLPEYLYDGYPGLQAIATRIEHIRAKRGNTPGTVLSPSRDGTRPPQKAEEDVRTVEGLESESQESVI